MPGVGAGASFLLHLCGSFSCGWRRAGESVCSMCVAGEESWGETAAAGSTDPSSTGPLPKSLLLPLSRSFLFLFGLAGRFNEAGISTHGGG